MKMYTFRVLLLSIVLLVGVSGVSIFAQETTGPAKDSVSLLCKDYSLSNVLIELSPELPSVSAGETILIHGIAKNTSNFPITEANILIKVYKTDHMVARFMVPLDATIRAGENNTFSFSWKTPNSLLSGDYAVTASLISADRFNFSNVALSDSFGKNYAQVKVVGTSVGELFLNKGKAKATGGVIEMPLENTFSKKVDAAVKWTVYKVSDIDGTNPIETHVEVVSVPARGSQKLSYTVKEVSPAEYYVVVEAKYSDATSTAVIPFTQGTSAFSTIRFLGIKETSSDSHEVFGCVSNSFTSPQKTIFITAMDKEGEIFTKKFDLGVSSSVGFSGEVSLGDIKDSVSVSAVVVSAEGVELDKVTTVYDCKTSGLCGGSTEKGFNDAWILYGITSISILGLLLLAFNKKRISTMNK